MHVHDTRLKIALWIVRHPGNSICNYVLTDAENFFNVNENSMKTSNENSNMHLSQCHGQVASLLETCTPICSPSKSPNDPRYATKQAKAENMIPTQLPSKYNKTRVLNYDEY